MYGNEIEMLRGRGVSVIRYERYNDEISAPLRTLGTALDAVWSRKAYQEVASLIRRERPDLAHFHNIWYLISPSAYHACRDAGIPVVQTLHNFRMFCANGLLMKDGMVCERCIGRVPWRGAFYGCFRNSRLYSLPVAVAEIAHNFKSTWADMVDMYIALTEFGRQKFIRCGLPADKVVVKPNFLSSGPIQASALRNDAIFIGRLSEEKGINKLIDASVLLRRTGEYPIMIVGDGPLRSRIESRIRDERLKFINLSGRKTHQECIGLLSGAKFLISPSICYENFPVSVIEAFACGKPVIASNLGALASIIEDKKTGLLFEPGNAGDLAAKILWMIGNENECIEMGNNARAEFENKYTAERNFGMLMSIYERVLSRSART